MVSDRRLKLSKAFGHDTQNIYLPDGYLKTASTITNYRGTLFLVTIVLVVNVEVAELVGGLVHRNHTQPITEGLLLQVLLGQILQVLLGECHVGLDGDHVAIKGNLDLVGQLASTATDLDAVDQVLLLQRVEEVTCYMLRGTV